MKTELLTPDLRKELDDLLIESVDELRGALNTLFRECQDDTNLRSVELGLNKQKAPTMVQIGGLDIVLRPEAARVIIQEEIARRFNLKMAALQILAGVARALGEGHLDDALQRAYELNAKIVYDKKELQND